MITFKELKQGYEALGEKIKSFENCIGTLPYYVEVVVITTSKEAPKEWPQVGDTYFWITKEGYVCYYAWDDSHVDRAHLEMGNVFRTHEEAEREVTRRKVTAKLKAIAAKYPPCDWKDRHQPKHYIAFAHNSGSWIGEVIYTYQTPNLVHSPDERYITEALALGDELNVLH